MNKLLLSVGGVLAIMLATWGASCYSDYQLMRDRALRHTTDSLKVKAHQDKLDLMYKDSVVEIAGKDRIVYQNRIFTPGRTAAVPIDSVRELKNRCDAEKLACADQRAAAARRIGTLEEIIKSQDKIIAQPEPRFRADIDVLYDPFRKSPAFRVTPSARAFGPIGIVGSASVAQELVVNKQTQLPDTTFAWRAEIGLRYTFK